MAATALPSLSEYLIDAAYRCASGKANRRALFVSERRSKARVWLRDEVSDGFLVESEFAECICLHGGKTPFPELDFPLRQTGILLRDCSD